ncbi:hypothetical protein O181_078665 [Austropuccinia psidii MF-1]|uniref:Uncharacterized protein n=1 Tax=Austropuccinia psidii MF-1 TaxID=1389203 RepID=A0A9Q3FD93_9BASI|nr:hypothetical protein [Austropuccinia psidii MF-1]
MYEETWPPSFILRESNSASAFLTSFGSPIQVKNWDRVGPPVFWDAPTGAGTSSVPSDPSSSTEFSSSSSPSSPGPLEMVLEVPGNPPTTPENELYLLGTLPSFLDGAAPSKMGPLSNLALS